MRRFATLVVLTCLLAGCTATPPAAPGASRPTATAPAPTTTQPQGRPVSFPATDAVALTGMVYGSGPTAVILSNMGDNDPQPWRAFAPLLAARGYTVLTYSFRYPLRTNAFTTAMATGTVPDLLGAVAYLKAAGASRIVLIGASLGGITVGKVGASAGAAAVVIISAEQDLSAYGLTVSAQELAALTVPKLFVASEQDTNTPFADTRAFYERAPPPKELKTYPGGVHGVGLFATSDGDDLRRRLVDFVLASAAP
jgi:dienelactone hydrolase